MGPGGIPAIPAQVVRLDAKTFRHLAAAIVVPAVLKQGAWPCVSLA